VLAIDLDSPVPLGEQLVAGLRRLIASSSLRPGDELPPVRQLAADLGINLNTVARAYRELEADGLATTSRGRGTRVTADRGTRNASAERVAAQVRALLTEAKLAGLGAGEVRALVDRTLPEFWPTSASPSPASTTRTE